MPNKEIPWNAAKLTITKKANEVVMHFVFPDEYGAMLFLDLWREKEVEITWRGERTIREVE